MNPRDSESWGGRVLIGVALALLLADPEPARAADEDDTFALDPTMARVGDWLAPTGAAESTWKGDAELGYFSTAGNEDTESIQGRGRVENDREQWRHSARADFLFSEDDSGQRIDRLQITDKSAYKLSPQDYLFGLLKYARDSSQGYRRQTIEVIGYGRRLASAETAYLDLEAGPGARQTWPSAGGYDAEVIAVLIAELDWDFTQEINFNEYLTVESGASNTFTGSITALTMSLTGGFSLRSAYEIKHNSSVPRGVRRTDTTTSLTLVYKF